MPGQTLQTSKKAHLQILGFPSVAYHWFGYNCFLQAVRRIVEGNLEIAKNASRTKRLHVPIVGPTGRPDWSARPRLRSTGRSDQSDRPVGQTGQTDRSVRRSYRVNARLEIMSLPL